MSTAHQEQLKRESLAVFMADSSSWRCPSCKDLPNAGTGKAHWNGEAWEHRCVEPVAELQRLQAAVQTLKDETKALRADKARLDIIISGLKSAEAFKRYVHDRLDAAGIPTHPGGPHSKEGCRVGDRLDILVEARDRAQQTLPELYAENTSLEQQVARMKVEFRCEREVADADRERAHLAEERVKALTEALTNLLSDAYELTCDHERLYIQQAEALLSTTTAPLPAAGDFPYEDLIPEIEIGLGWGCNAEHVGEVLQLMEGQPLTWKSLHLALRTFSKRRKETAAGASANQATEEVGL